MQFLNIEIPDEIYRLVSSSLSSSEAVYLSRSCKEAKRIYQSDVFSLNAASARSSQIAWDVVENKGSIFLTGAAGVGKSHTMREIKKKATAKGLNIAMTGTTGISAANLDGGETLHSFAGIHPRMTLAAVHDKLALGHLVGSSNLTSVDILVIDEVSMLSTKVVELLDLYAKARRGNDLPFGGIQLVFCGDLYQLPPVCARFFFHSVVWEATKMPLVDLTISVRHMGDRRWERILKEARLGGLSDKSYSILSTRVTSLTKDQILSGNYGTVLVPRNQTADEYNRLGFEKNSGKVVNAFFSADSVLERIRLPTGKYQWDVSSYPIQDAIKLCKPRLYKIPSEVEMKEGALYILTHNLKVKVGWVNGLVCRYSAAQAQMVPLQSAQVPPIPEKVAFAMIDRRVSIDKTHVFLRRQIPFRLAYALTIHSSQGMTLSKAVVDAGTRVFAAGQTYVALSRVESLAGLTLTALERKRIRASKQVKSFLETYPYMK